LLALTQCPPLKVLKRGTVESDILYHDTERVKGLGFAPTIEMEGMETEARVDVSHLIEEGGEVLEGEGVPTKRKEAAVWERSEGSPRAAPRAAPAEEDIYGKAKVDKKAKKAEKKAKKAEKKEKKREKKEKKEARRSRHDSRSPPRRDRDRSRSISGARDRSPRGRSPPRQRRRYDSDSD